MWRSFATIASFLAIWAIGGVAAAQAPAAWVSIGPPGAAVSSIAVHPHDASHLLIGTANGAVFESRDGGTSWLRAPSPSSATSVGVALGPERQWAATADGVFVRADGGGPWSRAGLEGRVIARIVADPMDDDVAWAVADQFVPVAGRVLVTADAGASWTPMPMTHPVGDILLDPDDSATVWLSLNASRTLSSPACVPIGTSGGVYRSTDRGAAWRKLDVGFEFVEHHGCLFFPPFPKFGGVQQMAIASTSPRTLWAAMTEAVSPLYRSVDEGMTWTSAGGAFPAGAVSAVRASGTALYVVVVDMLGNGTTVARSTDGGDSWATILTLPETDQIVDWNPVELVVSGDRVYVARAKDGLFVRSDDRGDTWVDGTTGIVATDVSVLYVEPMAPGTVLAGARQSDDGGATWRTSNLTGTVNAFAASSDALYATTTGGLWSRPRRGGPWRLLPTPGGFFPRTSLAIDHADATSMYGIDANSGLMRPRTGPGVTWEFASIGGLIRPLAVAISGLAGSPAGAFVTVLEDGAVFRGDATTDRWERVGTVSTPVNALVAGATAEAGLWAATSVGVFRSPDDGATWAQVGRAVDARTVVLDPDGADVAYAATSAGVVRSIGGGAWKAVGTGLEQIDVRALAMERTPRALVAGTIGRGAFRLAIPPCGDGVVAGGESRVAEAVCLLPSTTELGACMAEGKRAAAVRRRLTRLLNAAGRAAATVAAKPGLGDRRVRRARRVLARLVRLANRAERRGLLHADCDAFDGSIERSLRLLQ